MAIIAHHRESETTCYSLPQIINQFSLCIYGSIITSSSWSQVCQKNGELTNFHLLCVPEPERPLLPLCGFYILLRLERLKPNQEIINANIWFPANTMRLNNKKGETSLDSTSNHFSLDWKSLPTTSEASLAFLYAFPPHSASVEFRVI